MTGFGRAEADLNGLHLAIEVKSLNSRHFDLNLKLPSVLRPFENQARKILQERIGRGKADVSVQLQSGKSEDSYQIVEERFDAYIEQLKKLASKHQLNSDLMALALKMPEVINHKEEELTEDLEKLLESCLVEAVNALCHHREEEGQSLAKDLMGNLQGIENRLNELAEFESDRKESLRERLQRNLQELGAEADPVRFHQELIFYLEKWDINEERVRLASHIELFTKEMNEGERQGRKLQFVSQEIGREINTIGSKCQHAEMQKRVVEMKDHLEQIKEQLGNIL
jgi:uncharacterized protein (TIGR00255 family)